MQGVLFYRDPSIPFIEMKQCNDKTLSYKKHFHEEYSIGVIDEGSSKVWFDGDSMHVEAGRVVWIPPYLPHACNPQEGSNWNYKMLFVHPEWVKRMFGSETGIDAPFLFDRRTNQRMNSCLSRIFYYLKSQSTPLETESVALEMVTFIRQEKAVEESSSRTGSVGKKNLTWVKEYLHEHYLDRITLEQLEQVSGISRYHLIHLFKKEHNIPPHAYQNLLRINFSKKEYSKSGPLRKLRLKRAFTIKATLQNYLRDTWVSHLRNI